MNCYCYTMFLLQLVLVATVSAQVNSVAHLHRQVLFCWPLGANAERPIPFPSCPGITIYRPGSDPDHLSRTEEMVLTYVFKVNSSFYPWAVQKGIFDKAGPSGFWNATKAEQWCTTTECPELPRDANQTNCCLHHVDLLLCPVEDDFPEAPCRPWIPEYGVLMSPSPSQAGPVTQEQWTFNAKAYMAEKTGNISLLVVFKVAGMIAVLENVFHTSRNPVCGDDLCEDGQGENCGNCIKDCGTCRSYLNEILTFVAIVLGFLIIIGFCLGLYYWKKQRINLLDETWIVHPTEIVANATESTCTSVWSSGDLVKNEDYPTLSVLVVQQHHLGPRTKPLLAGQYHIPVALVRGQIVALKKYRNDEFQLTHEIRKEVFTVRQLIHPNLCRFVGGTVLPGTVQILYEYCPKGSLVDVLQNDAISLNWIFRFSMLTDVSRGMAFLHRHHVIHGNLKSSNCVVDDRWICKVTDFGLQEYRREIFHHDDETEAKERKKEKLRQDQMYRAPEADTSVCLASDVFSFAIIMIEVATRRRATYEVDSVSSEPQKPALPQFISIHSLSAESVVLRAVNSKSDKVDHNLFSSRYQELITKCWQDKQSERPDFTDIEEELHRMYPSNKNPVDTMMALMQLYSKNLEQLVEKRSRELLEEKQKTEALLHSILPRAVADSLRNGKQVVAECFENSTVFFSDIVGFTNISARSTPMQIVGLLNKLYTIFDSIIESHHVYKVETIGDAYMVVSGVPSRTKQHAYHAALMALEIVSATKQFVVPHLPDEQIAIKAGLDSGPVCAGVVGVTMPRYCLFGDTVNTASRMESNSRAGCIHITTSSYNLLQPHGIFICEPRGTINVKGKGDMVTWWLRGRFFRAGSAEDLPYLLLSQGADSLSLDSNFLTNAYF